MTPAQRAAQRIVLKLWNMHCSSVSAEVAAIIEEEYARKPTPEEVKEAWRDTHDYNWVAPIQVGPSALDPTDCEELLKEFMDEHGLGPEDMQREQHPHSTQQ